MSITKRQKKPPASGKTDGCSICKNFVCVNWPYAEGSGCHGWGAGAPTFTSRRRTAGAMDRRTSAAMVCRVWFRRCVWHCTPNERGGCWRTIAGHHLAILARFHQPRTTWDAVGVYPSPGRQSCPGCSRWGDRTMRTVPRLTSTSPAAGRACTRWRVAGCLSWLVQRRVGIAEHSLAEVAHGRLAAVRVDD